jgi:DNA-binding SARP family transcriptional activator
MGVNLESGNLRRLYQRHPISGWSRSPAETREDHPVRIYTLGRFGIQVHGHAIAAKQSRQHRPVELLQALIALGGRDVGVEVLSQALWPDAEGDLAKNTFDVTLHRLRRMFEIKELLVLCDHRLTLNSHLAWVDVWTFERLVNYAERLLPRVEDQGVMRQLARVGERLGTLYQGNFLDREAGSAWSLTLRERLRSKLLRHILANGRVWERLGEWEQAIRLYRKGLEIDPLTEALYQRLMVCYRETGQRGDALATFLRCQEILARQFQIGPSPATVALYSALKS